jgi:hypothetical protein
VYDVKHPTRIHLDARCPHATRPDNAGKPSFLAQPTEWREATADELKTLAPCKSCQANAVKDITPAKPKATRKPIARKVSPKTVPATTEIALAA